MKVRAVPFDSTTTDPLPEKCHVVRHFDIPNYIGADDTIEELGTVLAMVIQKCFMAGYKPKTYMIVVRFE
jgi:hypothetical protein